MDNLFFIKLLLSFVIGGSWVLVATMLADKFGPKVGGLVAGLPSTVMFGLFFIAWTQTPLAAVKATTVIPIIGGFNYLFLLVYVMLVNRGVWKSLLSAFSVWTVLCLPVVLFKFSNYFLSLLIYGILLAFAYYMMEYRLRVPSAAGKKVVYTPRLIAMRALLSGAIVALTVIAGKFGGPLFGGLFAAFPAMFTSTLLITYFAHGPEFSAATVKSSIVGAVSVVLYSIVVRFTYVNVGVLPGTLFAIITSFFVGFLIYKVIVRKLN